MRQWLVRFRWRRRGAWMWPLFIVLTLIDALIATELPPAGDGWNSVGAFLFVGFMNLAVIVALSVPVRWVLRRRRRDLPKVVAADYAGSGTMLTFTALLLVLGIIHQPGLHSDQRVRNDAIKRAQAFIGTNAPARFRRNVQLVSTDVIDEGAEIFRECVPSLDGSQDYCVVVHDREPLAQSVSYAGAEPNGLLEQGTQ